VPIPEQGAGWIGSSPQFIAAVSGNDTGNLCRGRQCACTRISGSVKNFNRELSGSGYAGDGGLPEGIDRGNDPLPGSRRESESGEIRGTNR